MRLLAKFIFYKLMGWTFNGSFPTVKKCVFIVVPHTSNWDFLMGLVIRKIMNIEINYVGKKSLFNWPYGWFFRWTGGAPIDRTKNSDTVSAVAQLFKEREVFRLALSPEGTRKRVYQWKTGFYYIAKTANVPIILISFDYGKKEIKMSDPIWTTSDKTADFKTYEVFFDGTLGKNPDQGFFPEKD
jgi:1-acyl-sn-glycerol-3-phosphate acyltransferase